ncbi:MAG: hypothetical protein V1909_03630 [Candidatus Micrarchaeota archaeon]
MAESGFKMPSVGRRIGLAVRSAYSLEHMSVRANEFYKWGRALENEEKRTGKFHVAAKMFGRILDRAKREGRGGQPDYRIYGAYYVRALIMEACAREKSGEEIKAGELYKKAAAKATELGWDEKNFYRHFSGASEEFMPTEKEAADRLFQEMEKGRRRAKEG